MDSLSGATVRLVTPETPAGLDATRAILREYAATLGVDLGFQGFEAELAALPGAYAPPGGELLLAYVQDRLAGCGALRHSLGGAPTAFLNARLNAASDS